MSAAGSPAVDHGGIPPGDPEASLHLATVHLDQHHLKEAELLFTHVLHAVTNNRQRVEPSAQHQNGVCAPADDEDVGIGTAVEQHNESTHTFGSGMNRKRTGLDHSKTELSPSKYELQKTEHNTDISVTGDAYDTADKEFIRCVDKDASKRNAKERSTEVNHRGGSFLHKSDSDNFNVNGQNIQGLCRAKRESEWFSEMTVSEQKCLLRAYLGLGQVYGKRGRHSRSNEVEWHRHHLQALTMQRRALRLGRAMLQHCRTTESEQLAEGDSAAVCKSVEELVQRTQEHLSELETMYLRSLARRLVPAPEEKPHLAQPRYAEGPVDVKWLRQLQGHVRSKLASNCVGVEASPSDPDVSKTSASNDMSNEPEPAAQPRKKTDFNHVQKVILRLVRQITRDTRARYRRRRLTEDMLKQALATEMVTMMTPDNENDDMISVFEAAIDSDSSESDEAITMSEDNAEHNTEEAKKAEIPSFDLSSRRKDTMNGGSARPSSLVKPSAFKYYMKGGPKSPSRTISVVEQGCQVAGQSPVTPRLPGAVFSTAQSASPSPGVEPEFRLPGVLTIWRGHRQPASSRRPVLFQPSRQLGFEELSPVTEGCSYVTLEMGEGCSPVTMETDTRLAAELHSELQQAYEAETGHLSARSLDATLALVLSRLGDRLLGEDETDRADHIYSLALGLFQEAQHLEQEDAGGIGHLLLQLGKIRCCRGDIIGGTRLMEEAVEMYTRHHGSPLSVDAANVWYALGCAYLESTPAEDGAGSRSGTTESAVMEYTMVAIRRQLERKEHGGGDAYHSDCESDGEDSESGEDDYAVHVHEATDCLHQALVTLRSLYPYISQGAYGNDERAGSVYVRAETRLGDCCCALGDYGRAAALYEEALALAPAVAGAGVLTTHAHCLTMLGQAHFMLQNYPKAAAMLETAHVLQQHLYGGADAPHFDMVLNLTMLGISNYMQGAYHKCVAWCLTAYNMYRELFPELKHAGELKCWFIIQTAYMLGYAYSTIGFNEKALEFLNISKLMVLNSEITAIKNTKQLVTILKVMADVYTVLEEHELALQYYEDALQYAVSLGCAEHSATTLQNQLLNSMAGLHVSSKQYSKAANYLEQALNCQRTMETSIRGDMVGMLQQLGLTYTLSGDLDRAIDCYQDCVEDFRDVSLDENNLELAETLACLANLHHIKGCLEDDEDLQVRAGDHYREALLLCPCSGLTVQYANYLYYQGDVPGALLAMLDYIWLDQDQLDRDSIGCNIVYNGPEQAVLPSHLQHDLDDVDEVALGAHIFGHFLAVLCFKELNLLADAEDSLVALTRRVFTTNQAINYTMLGYALMEMHLLTEAAQVFCLANHLDYESDMALTNAWLCALTAVCVQLTQFVQNVWEYSVRPFDESLIVPYVVPPAIPPKDLRVTNKTQQQLTTTTSMVTDTSAPEPADKFVMRSRRNVTEDAGVIVHNAEERNHARDSGYFDHQDVISDSWTEATDSSSVIPEEMKSSSQILTSQSTQDVEEFYVSENLMVRNDGDALQVEKEEEEETWIEEEVVMEMPQEVLLELLKKQQADTEAALAAVPSVQNHLNSCQAAECEEEKIIANVHVESHETYVLNQAGKKPESEHCGLHSEITIDENENPTEEKGNEADTWTYSEDEVVETPAEILALLKGSQSSSSSSEETTGIQRSSIKETTSVTGTVLSVKETKCSSPISPNDEDLINGNESTFEKESEQQVWITEEVIDTPSYILDLMAQQANVTAEEQEHPLEQTIKDLQELAASKESSKSEKQSDNAIAMDISPLEEYNSMTEKWETIANSGTLSNSSKPSREACERRIDHGLTKADSLSVSPVNTLGRVSPIHHTWRESPVNKSLRASPITEPWIEYPPNNARAQSSQREFSRKKVRSQTGKPAETVHDEESYNSWRENPQQSQYIEELLKQSEEIEAELEESLRSIESHRQRDIHNNNGSSMLTPESETTSVASDTVDTSNQGVKRKGTLSDYIASKYKKWGKPDGTISPNRYSITPERANSPSRFGSTFDQSQPYRTSTPNKLTTIDHGQQYSTSAQSKFNSTPEQTSVCTINIISATEDKLPSKTDQEKLEAEPEQWQVWDEEEVVDTPPEILQAILRAQKQAC